MEMCLALSKNTKEASWAGSSSGEMAGRLGQRSVCIGGGWGQVP
jgi:hypothetical protein